jgi:CBS domain-containing protein
MKVADLMHKGAETLAPLTSIAAVAKAMKDKDVGALPITENGALVGIVTDRDVAIRALADGADLSNLTAKDVMSTSVAYCKEGDAIGDAADMMEKHKVRRLPVLDRANKVVGMLSLGDISHGAPRDLTSEVIRAVSAHHA